MNNSGPIADPGADCMPPARVERWTRTLRRFLAIESASGVLLLACAAAALALANSPWAGAVDAWWHTPLAISVGDYALRESLAHWINDGLMTIFFFVVGLEIKREIVAGELRDPRQAALPIVAAAGGMIAPALFFLALQRGEPGERGWGVPMATDIAFVVGFLALLGRRVPAALKVLLLAVAIVDDLGAVLVIALFYSERIAWPALAAAAAGFAVIYGFHRIGVRRVPVYVAVGAAIWLAVLKSGIHPTVAGVLLGLMTPASAWVGDRGLIDVLSAALRRARAAQDGAASAADIAAAASPRLLANLLRESESPLHRLETALHPWVAFGIMPLFALANAGVPLDAARFTDPLAAAIVVGLVVGKPVGIVLASWLAVRARLARLPTGVGWRTMIGGGCLAGIGFTMSLFIAGLAFDGDSLAAAKAGVLIGSTVAAAVGVAWLLLAAPRPCPPVKGPRDEEAEPVVVPIVPEAAS